ncbi:MAG: hypothetical protein DRJ69_05150 [Thermoprotei archaeon]|nr:MAG: hypothetical protein DRJ69_05150 [Thermoprotei archaeon]
MWMADGDGVGSLFNPRWYVKHAFEEEAFASKHHSMLQAFSSVDLGLHALLRSVLRSLPPYKLHAQPAVALK